MTTAPPSRRYLPTEWTPKAFFVAAVFFAIFAGFWIVQAFGGPSAPEARGPFGAAGWLAAFTGLLGLHRVFTNRSEGWGWAQAGTVLIVIGTLGASVSAISEFGSLIGIWGDGPAWLGIITSLILVGIVPGFLAYGIAVLRSEALPRSLGILLLLPALVFLINMTVIAALASGGANPPAWVAMVLASSQTIVLLAIGFKLHHAQGARNAAIAE